MMKDTIRVCCLLLVFVATTVSLSAAVDRDYPKEFYGQHNDRPMLGIYMGGSAGTGGVIIHSVIPGTAADGMGLQEGDVITTLNGVPIVNTRTLYREVQGSDVGSGVEVEIKRDGETLTYEGQYGVWPESLPKPKKKSKAKKRGSKKDKDMMAGQSDRPSVFDGLSNFLKRQAEKLEAARGPVAISGLHIDKDVVVSSPMIKALAAYSLENPEGFEFQFSMSIDANQSVSDLTVPNENQVEESAMLKAPACNIHAVISVDMNEL